MNEAPIGSPDADDRSPTGGGLARAVHRPSLKRRASALALIVVFGLLAPLGLITGWARSTLLDTSRYVVTVGPLASNPAIQRVVAAEAARLVVRQLVARGVPARFGTRLERDVTAVAERAVASELFQTIWNEANRLSHRQLVALLTGEPGASEAVVVDVSAIYASIESGLAELGYDVDLSKWQPADAARVTIISSSDVANGQRIVRLIDRVGLFLPAAALIALAAAIAAAPARVKTVRRGGVALMVGMVIAAGLVVGGRTIYLRALGESVPRDVATAVFDALTRSLWVAVIVLALVGVATTVGATIVERQRMAG